MGANATTSVPGYTSGDVLTAANLNITNSGIPVFADAAARDAAFDGTGEKTLAEGQFAFLEDTNETQVYDGSIWSAVGGGGAVPALKFVSGGIYLHPGRWNNNLTATNQYTFFMPLFTPEDVTFDRISCHTSSSFSGTATVRLGLFQVAEATGLPGDLILDAGTVSCTASLTQYNITISEAVPAGMFYMAFNSQTNAATNSFYAYNNTSSPEFNSFYAPRSQSNSNFTNLGQGLFNIQAGVSGAFSNAVPTGLAAACPTVAVRVA